MDLQKLRLILDASAAKAGADVFTKATDTVVAGATTATGGIAKMESAMASQARQARVTSDAVQKTAVSTEQARLAWEKSGGDMKAFTDELARMAGVQKQVTDSTMAMGRAHMQAIEMDQKLGQSFNTTGAGLGRLRMGLTSLAAQLTGTNPLLDRAAATIGTMGTSTLTVLGALAAVIAGGVIWSAYTEQGRKAVAEQDAMTKSLEKWFAKEREGAAGDFPRQIDAEREKIADLRKELDSFGKLGAVGEGGSKALAWVRILTEGLAGAFSPGFFQKIKDEIHNGAANATNEITTGFAAIHAANVKAHDLIQRQQANALASLITYHHATAAERAKARDLLKADIAELARLDQLALSSNGGTKLDQQQRVTLAEEIKKLQEALDPPKLQAAEDHLAGVKDKLAAMQQEASEFGKDKSIDARTDAIMEDLDRLEKKFPQLTDKIEDLKREAVTVGGALKGIADQEVANQIDAAYNAQKQLSDAYHDGSGTLRDLTASKRADMEIDRLRLKLGHDLNNDEKDKIHYTYENAAAIIDETEAKKKAAEADKQAQQKVMADQKRMYEELQRDASKFFDDTLHKGVKSFGDLFGMIRDMFTKLLADMAARWAALHFGQSVLGAFGVGSNGNGANPSLGAAGAGALFASGVVGFGVGQSMPSGTTAALGGMASGAATGAMIGSVVPVLGTAVGAVIGAVGGLVGGLLGHSAKVREEAKKLEQARFEFSKQLDTFVYGLGDHSDLDKNLHDLSTQMQAARDQAKDLKLGTADLAAAEAAAAAAGAKLKQQFLDSIDAQIRAAEGQSYLTEALDDQKAYSANLKDITLAGGDASKATKLFTDQLDQLAKGLTADQIRELLKELPTLAQNMDPAAAIALAKALQNDLAAALDAVAKATAAAAEQMKRASEDLQVRFAKANGGSTSLMELQFSQQRELIDAQTSGASPSYIAQLQLVHLYEMSQAKIQQQTDDQVKAIQDATKAEQAKQDGIMKAARDSLTVQQSALSVAEQNLNATQKVVQSLTDYSRSLLVSDLSPLGPAEQYAEAQRQLQDAYQKALGGDQDAANSVPSLASAFLQQSRSFNASGPQYGLDFASVQKMLDDLTSHYTTQQTNEQKLVDTAQQQVDLLTQQIDAAQAASDKAATDADAQIAALQDSARIEQAIRDDVVATLQSQRDALLAAADDQITALQQMLTGIDADVASTDAQLYALLDQKATMEASGIANLDAINRQIAETIALRSQQADARDKIAQQLADMKTARDQMQVESDAQIQAVHDGATFQAQATNQLQVAMAAHNLANIEARKAETDRLIDALNVLLGRQANTGGATDTGGFGTTNRPTLLPPSGNLVSSDSGDIVTGLQQVVQTLRDIKSDAKDADSATLGRLGDLAASFDELVQLGRFTSRENV